MTSGVEKSSDKRKRERSGDERYIEAKGNEAVVDGDRCKKKMYKEEREKDRGKEVRKEERKEGRTRKDEAEKEEWNSLRSSMRAKWSAKTETARCATASSVGRTQGLPATSAEGSFTTLPFLFFVDFFQLFETAYETSCSLSLSLLLCSFPRHSHDPFNDRGRGFHVDFTTKSSASYTNDTIAPRCNYWNVISSGK